jgi:hypothetical protein
MGSAPGNGQLGRGGPRGGGGGGGGMGPGGGGGGEPVGTNGSGLKEICIGQRPHCVPSASLVCQMLIYPGFDQQAVGSIPGHP